MSEAQVGPVTDDASDDEALRDLGSAVRARRRALGLRLSDVAEGTGLSLPFLSQIETSYATPSLTSLFAIARMLDTTPERLLAGPEPAEVVLTQRDEGHRYAVTDSALAAQRRQITGLGEPFSVAEYVVEPGIDLGGFFSSSGRELVHVTAGRLAVDIAANGSDDDHVTHELVRGDSLVYPTTARHRWRHIGRSPTRFLLVSSLDG